VPIDANRGFSAADGAAQGGGGGLVGHVASHTA
jgi:hypothetical protein